MYNYKTVNYIGLQGLGWIVHNGCIEGSRRIQHCSSKELEASEGDQGCSPSLKAWELPGESLL